jgi:twinkle protein
MSIAAALSEHGIRLRSYAQGEHRTTCPKCSHTRKKKTDPRLAVKIDGEGGAAWQCHHCPWTGNVPSERRDDFGLPPIRKPVARPVPVENADKPDTMYEWFEKRGISRETVDRFGCYGTAQWFPQANAEKRCVAIPYHRGGELVNHKYRSEKKEFRQDKDAERTLFNVDALEGQDTAIFVEGEMDVMALAEAGTLNVVSLPDGAPAKLKDEPDPDDKRFVSLANCETELSQIEKFIIAVDADEPGNVLAEELARRLGRERCWRVQWPTLNDAPRKDANEVLVEDGAEVLRECIEAAAPYPVSGLYGAAEFGEKSLNCFAMATGPGCLPAGRKSMNLSPSAREILPLSPEYRTTGNQNLSMP